MPLSEHEIKHLLEKAEVYMNASNSCIDSDDLQYLEQALKCYDQIIENAPLHPHYFEKRAQVKGMLAHRDGAIEDMSKAIELDPDQGGYYWKRGIFLTDKLYETNISDNDRKQLLERIIVDYKASVQRDPSNLQTWLCLMEINILSHNFDDAISIYGSCKPYIDTKKDKLVRSWLGCLALVLAGDPIEEEDKKTLYDQTIQLKLDDIVLKISSFLSKIREKEGYKEKYEKAIEIHELFIEHFNEWGARVSILSRLNRYEEALKAVDKAIELKPDFVEAWNKKGVMLENLNRYEEALKAFNKAIELKPDFVEAWNKKGVMLENLNRYEEALKAFNKALDLNPDYVTAQHNKALMLVYLNRYEEALKAFDKALELNPDYVTAQHNKALMLVYLNRYEEAIKAFERVIEPNPHEVEAWTAKGVCLKELKHYEEALEAYEKAIELKPGYAIAWKNKGNLLKKLNRYEEALKAIDKAIELDPDYAESWYNRACIYSLKGNKKNALTNLSKAIELDNKYKEDAKKETNFKNLWDDVDFKRIVG